MPQLSDEEVPLVVKALDHYGAYLVATQREDKRCKELAERLQRKSPAAEQAPGTKRKKA